MMYLKFAAKRLLRSSYPLLCIVCAVLVWLSSFASVQTIPAAGVCDLDGSAESRQVVEYLLDNGFAEFADESGLRELVGKGELDCGVVLPEGMSEMLERGDTGGLILFLESPSSFIPEIYKYHVAAAVFSHSAPHISAEAFEGSGVKKAEVLSAYETMFENGYAFSFAVESAEPGASAENVRRTGLVTGSSAILLFLLLASGAAGFLDNDFYGLRLRIGQRKSLLCLVLPGLTLRFLAAAVPVSLAALAAGEGQLVPHLWIFGLLMTDAALILSAVLPGRRSLIILLPLLLTAALALCPIFADISALLPAVKILRWLLPVWWLWPVQQAPLVWLAAGAIGLAAGISLFLLRGKARNS